MSRNPKNMEELLEYLEEMGYEIKRAKHIGIKGEGQKSFLRFDSLLDIQDIISKVKGPGYERWAKVHNNKQISQTLIYLRDHDIRDMDELKSGRLIPLLDL